MRRYLIILFALSFVSCFTKAQTIQFLGSPTTQIYVRGQLRVDTLFYLPLRDTTIVPAQIGAFVVKGTVPYFWTGTRWTVLATGSPIWGSVTGTLSNQTDLQSALNAKQDAVIPGYGIKQSGTQLSFDSAVVRKVDTLYALNDSTIVYAINGISRNATIRGTPAGGINSLVLTVSGTPFNNPVTFNNVSGAWSGSLVLASQNANSIWAGPTIGSPAQPTFRTMVTADLPTNIPNGNLANSTITYAGSNAGSDISISPTTVSLGGTVTVAIPDAGPAARGALTPGDWNVFNGKVTSVNGQGGVVITKNADSVKALPIDTTNNRQNYVFTFDSTNHKVILTPGASSGVTSVGLTAPAIFNVTGSPITGSGTFALTLANQTQNRFWGSPDGSSGVPAFRSIVNADLPTSGVTPGTYNSVTVNAQGIATAASNTGSGITSLNGLTGATQTFATGSTGTDFNIASSGTAHTFNIPTASASNRGVLSTSDYTNFTGKKNNNDSVAQTGYASNGHLKKVLDSIAGISDTTTYRTLGQPGDAILSVINSKTLGVPVFRDSLNVHHIINADSSWTWYATASDTAHTVSGHLKISRAGNVVNIAGDSMATKLVPGERVLYTANTWTTGDLGTTFTYTGTIGSDVSISSGKILMANGTQTLAAGNNSAFNKVLKLNSYGGTLLPQVKITTVYRVNGTLSSTTAGVAPGQYSINALGSLSNMMGWTNTTTTATGTTYAVLGTSNAAIVPSASVFAYTSGQQIMIIVERDGDKVFVSSKNLTTDSPMVQTMYQWDGTNATNGITPNVPNTGVFGWANLSSCEIDSIAITTRVPYGAPMAMFTDSKGLYACPNDASLCAQTRRYYPGTVLCYGPTDGIRDLRARQREIDSIIHPTQALMISVPRNEVAFGTAATIWKPACISFDSALRANGIISIWTDGIFENQINQNDLTFFIDSAFGTPQNAFGPKLIKTKAVGAVAANVASDNIHLSVLGAYNNSRTIYTSGKIIDYGQYINSTYSPDNNWTKFMDSVKFFGTIRNDFGAYHPASAGQYDWILREGAKIMQAFGTNAQQNWIDICLNSNAALQLNSAVGGNLLNTPAIQFNTTLTTGVSPSHSVSWAEDGREFIGRTGWFRMFHAAAPGLDVYFNGGIWGGANSKDSTDGGYIPYDASGNSLFKIYGRNGTFKFFSPTSQNTVRNFESIFPGGHFSIGDSTDHSTMLSVAGAIWQRKDSLQTSSTGSVMSLGIDTISGLYVKFPQVTPSNLYNTDGSLTGNRTIGLNSFNLTVAGTGNLTFQPSGQISINAPTFISSAFGASWDVTTSGTTYTIPNITYAELLNPASVIAAFTYTLAAAPINGQVIMIHFGGTITSGNPVVTSLTISPNSGQTLVQSTAPTTALSGDCIIYRYLSASSSWYREK